MPEFTVIYIAIFALSAVIGAVIGWVIRGIRSTQEKAAVSTGWQEQVEAQRTEHHRLVIQNRRLMDQVSQFQASSLDAKQRAKDLSSTMIEACARRDELQREIKEIRANLELAVSERDKLQTDLETRGDDTSAAQEKDEKIFQLSRELENWHSRLPPLIERYRIRNEEAEQLEADLSEARLRIEELEGMGNDEQTGIEPVRHPDALTDGHDASNDPSDSRIAEEAPIVESVNDHHHTMRHDDLKQIKGVGPAIEKTLIEMGISRFEQIADMSEYDIDRIARRLKGFHSRIYREDWIGQARALNDRNKRG
jgi:predicted flap endonuclease-1-like 5' DNA nuclease